MRYRFSIPLTALVLIFLLWIGTSYLDVTYVFTAITCAVWAAQDSHAIGLQRFEGTFGHGMVSVAVVVLVSWPVAFPYYLKTRWLAKAGRLPVKGTNKRNSIPRRRVVVIGGVALLLLVAAARSRRGMSELALIRVGQEFHSEVRIDIDGPRWILSMVPPESIRDSAAYHAYARKIGERFCMLSGRTEGYDTVTIILERRQNRSGISVGYELAKFTW